jgi:valyl-tRNA synthetase
MGELSKSYDPSEVEPRWRDWWVERGLFRADAHSGKPPFCIVIPPPNVTGQLHMGHAMFTTLQDVLTRWKRMAGFEALWVPGTDHAGIATQVLVERHLLEQGIDPRELGREGFLEHVWRWKDRYHARITEQLKKLGVSVDWDRERFTMDDGLSDAVRKVFVDLYQQGLIYQDDRLVNWDPVGQTVLSDLEVEQEEEDGSLWHIAYPPPRARRRCWGTRPWRCTPTTRGTATSSAGMSRCL